MGNRLARGAQGWPALRNARILGVSCTSTGHPHAVCGHPRPATPPAQGFVRARISPPIAPNTGGRPPFTPFGVIRHTKKRVTFQLHSREFAVRQTTDDLRKFRRNSKSEIVSWTA